MGAGGAGLPPLHSFPWSTRAPHPQTCCQRRQSRGQGSPQVRVGPTANKPEAGGVKILEACRKGEGAQGESSRPGLGSGTHSSRGVEGNSGH